MFIEILKKLMHDKGISNNKLLTDLGLNKSSILNWEKRGTIPSGETLEMIADYFDVSVDYLLGKTPSPEREDIPEDEKRLRELLSQMSEEQLKTALKIISAIAEEK
mgnify:FL=1